MKTVKGSRNKSGVYSITNLLTNQVYVGSSYNIGKRLVEHIYKLKKGKHPNIYLQRSWNKYGEDVFVADVITECLDLVAQEQFWIDKLNSTAHNNGYNLCPTAYSQQGRIQSQEEKDKRAAKFKNRVYSKESKVNMSLGRLGMKFSSAHVANMSRVREGKVYFAKPVLQLDLQNNLIAEWPSSAVAARTLKISFGGISDCANNKRTTHRGFIWKFKN